MIGELPSEFLRVPSAEQVQAQLTSDGELARRLAQQEMGIYTRQQPHHQYAAQRTLYTDRLLISVVEAKLNKNYGMTRMDPFCAIRVNHSVYETETCQNGAKNPTWQRPISVMISEPVHTVYIEIYDEGTITANTKIAWAKIQLPDSVKAGETLDDWWPLSGGLGAEKEGTIHLIFSQKKFQHQPQQLSGPRVQLPLMMGNHLQQQAVAVPAAAAVTPAAAGIIQQQQQQQQPQQPQPMMPPAAAVPQGPAFTDEDIIQIHDLFPGTDEQVIKTVLEATRGNKNAAIDIMLNIQ